MPLVIQFYDLKILDILAINIEPDKRAHSMETAHASRSRIDMQQVQYRVIFHLKQMRMTRYEQLRRIGNNILPDTCVILARITAYMLHHHIHILTPPPQHKRKPVAKIAAVYIAIHSPQRSYLLKAVGHLHSANVARMPYLITLLEIFHIPLVPPSVSV